MKTASPTFRRGVLMGDWNDANILVDPQEPERVVGAIDFGDSTYRSVPFLGVPLCVFSVYGVAWHWPSYNTYAPPFVFFFPEWQP